MIKHDITRRRLSTKERGPIDHEVLRITSEHGECDLPAKWFVDYSMTDETYESLGFTDPVDGKFHSGITLRNFILELDARFEEVEIDDNMLKVLNSPKVSILRVVNEEEIIEYIKNMVNNINN